MTTIQSFRLGFGSGLAFGILVGMVGWGLVTVRNYPDWVLLLLCSSILAVGIITLWYALMIHHSK